MDLRSKKLLATFVTAAINLIGYYVGIPESVTDNINKLAIVYLAGQSSVDAIKGFSLK